MDFFFNFFSRGQINFNSFADFLAGRTAFGLLGNGVRDRGMRSTDLDLFVQDDFRATDRLGKYKVPKDVVFVDNLPRTPYGKVVKAELREQYLALGSGHGLRGAERE